MIVLGVETSCDDTGVAIFDGEGILANSLYTQIAHYQFGGVVPEIASRNHIMKMVPVFKKAIEDSSVTVDEIDGIAATYGPGLVGSLLVGLSFAKGLAYSISRPFIGINHLEAHLLSPFIGRNIPEEPFLGLIASGGHTELYIVNGIGRYKLLGSTLDDACGEAFDKVAKLIGVGYPGGPYIEMWAARGNPFGFNFPVPNPPGLDFSFSGLKTAVLYAYKKLSPEERINDIPEIAASFMRVAIEALIIKLTKAIKETGIKSVAISGGVSANSLLRKRVRELGVRTYFPEKNFTSDNGGMVAFLGYQYLARGESSPLDLRADANARIISK